MTRLLVTGLSGLLGSNLALEAAQEHEVFGVVNSRPVGTDALKVLQVDLRDPALVRRTLDETQPDWVVNCAALADLEACEADPALAGQLNVDLPARLAEETAQRDIRLLHISTDAVFDGQRGDYSEDDDPNPLSVYAGTKLAGERRVAEANPDALVARVNMFGWSPSGRRSLAEFFFYNLSEGNPLKGFTDVFFCPLLVNDLARILRSMLSKGLSGLYHVASADCLSKYDFGLAIARQFGLDESLIAPASVTAGGLTAARAPKLTLRTDKLARDLGEPPPSIAEGMQRFYELHQRRYPQQLQQMLLAGAETTA